MPNAFPFGNFLHLPVSTFSLFSLSCQLSPHFTQLPIFSAPQRLNRRQFSENNLRPSVTFSSWTENRPTNGFGSETAQWPWPIPDAIGVINQFRLALASWGRELKLVESVLKQIS
jgi:hypothetical protein